MAADFTIKAYDRVPSLLVVLSANGQPVNLTGATVMFIMRPAAGGAVKINAPAVIVDAVSGIVRRCTRTSAALARRWRRCLRASSRSVSS